MTRDDFIHQTVIRAVANGMTPDAALTVALLAWQKVAEPKPETEALNARIGELEAALAKATKDATDRATLITKERAKHGREMKALRDQLPAA